MKADRPRNILLFQRIVPSYRVPVFRRLYHEFGIICCHSRQHKASNISSALHDIDFPHELLSGFHYKKSPTAVIQNPLKVLRKYKPRIVISEGSSSYLTLWILKFLAYFFNYKMVIWTHGIKNNEIFMPFSSLSSKMALNNFRRADAILLYSNHRKEILERYINNPDKLFIAKNTLDTEKLNDIFTLLNKKGKKQICEELKIKSNFNIIYVGRLLKSKKIELLLGSYKKISRDFDITLHIIGYGPEEEIIKDYQKVHAGIEFHGPIHDNELLGKYLYVSDLMVIPGAVGLSVIHAFAFGCPLLTCEYKGMEGPFHGPEKEYLLHNINGYVVEPDPGKIANVIKQHFQDEDKKQKMSEACLETLYKKASIHQMLKGFHEMIQYLSKK